MDQKPDRISRTIDRWMNRPAVSACLYGLAAIVLLIVLAAVLRPVINAWSWAAATLLAALAAWTGYRVGRLRQENLKLRVNQVALDSELVDQKNVAASLRDLLNQDAAAVFSVDPTLRITFWNRRSAEWFEKLPADVLGQPLGAGLPADLAMDVAKLCAETLDQQVAHSTQVTQAIQNSRRVYECNASPMVDGVVVSLRDATEHALELETARISAENYRAFFEDGFDAAFIFDLTAERILDVNARMCTLWATDRETLLRKNALDLIVNDVHHSLQALRRKVLKTATEGPQTFEWLAKDANGKPFWVDVGIRRIAAQDRPLLVGGVRDISNRKKATGELDSLTTKLRVISRSARNMTASLGIPGLARLVVESIQEATPCYSANVFIATDGGFRWAAGEGGDLSNYSTVGLFVPPGEGLIGISAQQGKPILVPDVLADERYIIWERLPETRSELVYPVKIGEQVVALVDLQSTEKSGFDSSDLEAVNALADQMAVAFENLKLVEDTRRWAHEMEMLVQITTDLRAALTRNEVIPIVLDSLVKLFRAEGALMSLKDTLSGEQVVELGRGAWIAISGRRFSEGKGILGKVAASSCSILNNDLPNTKLEESPRISSGLQALACVPLIAQELVIGTLAIGRSSIITGEELHIFETIADIVASAIQRSNLFDQTEKRLRQVQSLRTIDMAITADMSLRVTLHIVLDQVMMQLRVDAADILLFRPETKILEYTAGLGFRSRAVPQNSYSLGEEIAGIVAQERRTISILNFLSKEPAYSRSAFMAEEGMLSYFGVPMFAKGQLLGVLEIFHRSPLNPEYEWLQLMEALSVQAAIAINNAELFESLQQSNQELVQAYDTTLEGWARALELRDRETEGHSRRVTSMTVRLARQMGFSEDQLVHVRRGALLHDIGKMGIPDSILFKPGLLDEKEWEIMRLHPVHAYQLLAPIPYLQPALEIPYSHHERWDGTGYPLGLKGEEIPLSARIFAIVDIWDALISDRPYQTAWEEPKIRDYLVELAGKQLDPKVVKAFFEMLGQMEQENNQTSAALI